MKINSKHPALTYKILKVSWFILLLLLLSNISLKAEVDSAKFSKTVVLLRKGVNLTGDGAQKLEEDVKANPANIDARIQLLGYYYPRSHNYSQANNARLKHIIWIIQNHPEDEIAGQPYAQLHPEPDKDTYNRVKQLWQRQIAIHEKNTAILGNAASFFLMHELDESESLLKKAQSLEFNNAKWAKRLGELYKLKALSAKEPETKNKIQEKFFEQHESILKDMADPKQKFYMLAGIANAAFESKKIKKAEKYALELLDMSRKYEKDLYYGSAVHLGNIILGRIALKAENLENAKDFLLKAGATTGSPQIKMFGPNMTLAKELLERGERKIVIEYLKLCRKFWEKDKMLNNWIQEIEAGGVPKPMVIMGNLSYY